MTLKKIDELLEDAKKYAYEKVNNDPREIDYIDTWFTSYFLSSLFREIFRSKNDHWGNEGSKAFDKWSKKDYEINHLKIENSFNDIIKEFLNRR